MKKAFKNVNEIKRYLKEISGNFGALQLICRSIPLLVERLDELKRNNYATNYRIDEMINNLKDNEKTSSEDVAT